MGGGVKVLGRYTCLSSIFQSMIIGNYHSIIKIKTFRHFVKKDQILYFIVNAFSEAHNLINVKWSNQYMYHHFIKIDLYCPLKCVCVCARNLIAWSKANVAYYPSFPTSFTQTKFSTIFCFIFVFICILSYGYW